MVVAVAGWRAASELDEGSEAGRAVEAAVVPVVVAAGRAADGEADSCRDPLQNTGLKDLHPLKDSLKKKK